MSIRPIGFPCTVERQPLDKVFPFPHNVVLESMDDWHEGDVVIEVGRPGPIAAPRTTEQAA